MTATANGVPTQLGHLALRVRNVDRAVQFYAEVLGLTVKSRTHGIAFLGAREDASHELALFPLSEDAPGPEEGRVGSTTWPGRWPRLPSWRRCTGGCSIVG